MRYLIRGDLAYIEFATRHGEPAAPIETKYGIMRLFIGQICTSVVEDGAHMLRTSQYRYALTPEGSVEPLFRWEYIRSPGERSYYCRHHVQGSISIEIGGQRVRLSDWHFPTGWVAFEDIVRFCLHDLGCTSLAPTDEIWHAVLEDSYRRFRTRFSATEGM